MSNHGELVILAGLRTKSLIGLLVLLISSVFPPVLIGLEPSFTRSLIGGSGLNLLLVLFSPIVVMAVSFAYMAKQVSRAKHYVGVNESRATNSTAITLVGFVLYILGTTTPSYGCPPQGVCWTQLVIPLAFIALCDIGAILLQTSFRKTIPKATS
jgi:hypothetical protein